MEAPKNYAYKTVSSNTNKTKTLCKVHGITLNNKASQLVNFDVIKDMNLNGEETDIVTVHAESKIK